MILDDGNKIPGNESDEERLARLEEENRKLRKIWWMNHGCDFPSLYGDDGEMQCSKCMVDFNRDTIESIVKMVDRQKTKEAVEAHSRLAMERGKCEQCQKPWHDGMCECDSNDDEEWHDRCRYIANMAFLMQLEHL